MIKNNFYITLSFLLICSIMICLVSCTPIYFDKAMPQSGKIVKYFPEFLEGTFKENSTDDYIDENNFGTVYYDLELVNNHHLKVFKYSENNIETLIEKLQENHFISEVTLKGNDLVITKIDTIIFVKDVQQVGENSIRSKRVLTFEIDLEEENITIFNKDDRESYKCQLKQKNETYFFNICLDSLWLPFAIQKNKSDLNIITSEIGDLDLEELGYRSKYNIKEDNNDNNVSSLTDSEFDALMATSELIKSSSFIKVDKQTKKENLLYYKILIALIALALLLFGFKKMKK